MRRRIVWPAVIAGLFAYLSLAAVVFHQGTDTVLAFGILAITSAILALREEK